MTHPRSNPTAIFSHLSIAAALIGALFLSVESNFSLKGSSLCSTEACGVVGSYLKISEPFLVAGGAGFFWLLALVLFFAGRYPKLRYLPLFLLAPALAFDSGLIGFQVFSIGRFCLLCFLVAALLLIVAVLNCLAARDSLILITLILIWGGGFGVQAVLTMPPPKAAFANMVFFAHQANVASERQTDDKLTLIISMHCSHCLDVVDYLAHHPPNGYTLLLASVDQDQEALHQLEFFLQRMPASANPYQLLTEIKKGGNIGSLAVRASLPIQTKNSLNFLSNLGIVSIPALWVEKSPSDKRIITGSENIIDFLKRSDTDNPGL